MVEEGSVAGECKLGTANVRILFLICTNIERGDVNIRRGGAGEGSRHAEVAVGSSFLFSHAKKYPSKGRSRSLLRSRDLGIQPREMVVDRRLGFGRGPLLFRMKYRGSAHRQTKGLFPERPFNRDPSWEACGPYGP